MRIEFKNIPKFQNGGVPQWYLDRYGNRTSLIGWDMNKRYNYANQNLNTNDHRNAGSLETVYNKNIAYTGTPDVISSDIQSFYNSDANGMSAEEFVNFYNKNAEKIRSHWTQDRTYNTNTAGEHNRLFKRMFQSRSNLSESPGKAYNIGYLDDLENIEGSSTWLRRMDLYENEFDVNNQDLNRIHEITLKDGTKAKFYKKANGDIGLLPIENLKPIKPMPITPPDQKLQVPDKIQIKNEIQAEVPGDDEEKEKTGGFDWNKIKGSLLKSIPGIIEGVRLVGNHIANEKIYGEALKGIRPDLMQSYNTYRQVVGDEATKQAYYRRAIQGLTKAARPFTSDADKQMAYLFEAKRVGDELKAQGDLADNLRIRETSELSSQHLDANRQRATEVANANNKAINYANSLKHNLLALKHAAQWSSVDNYLLGLAHEYKATNERNKLWNLLAWLLLREGEIENDKQLEYLRKLFDTAAAKPLNQKLDSFGLKVINYDSDEIRDLVQQIKNRNRELQFETFLQRRILFGKSGTKVTVKKKEKNDLLYKSTRDTVEHFRKMSKMSSDAQNRKRIKIDKLAPHPKGTKKYQQGGLAPFLVYKPTILGGETTTTTQTDNSSSKSSKSGSSTDLEIDLLKDLFKNLAVEGLPSDTNIIYSSMMELMNRRKLFGNSLSSGDIESMYIHLLEKINAIKYNKAQFDKVSEIVHNKNADSEIAIDNLGRIAVQNLENKEVEYKHPEDLEKGKYVPLTNQLLLNLRAISPNMAFDSGSALQTAANATSMLEIAKFLKEQLPSIESSETVIEGYTKKESNNIKEGLKHLLYDAPEGDYKYTETNKNNLKQIESALEYLKNVLPNNMKNYLKIKSGGNPDGLIKNLLGSKVLIDLKTQLLAVTGKASSSNKTSSGGEGSDGLKLDAVTALVTGKGFKTEIELNPGSSYSVKALGRFTEFLKKSGENMGAGTTMLEATESTLNGTLDWNKATIGGSKIIPTAYNQVILNNGEVAGVDLPIDPNNPDTPNFDMLKQLENLDKQLKLNNIEDNEQNWLKVNDLCDRLNIPRKYDSSGKLNQLNWKRFAAFLVTTPDTALVNKSVILDMVGVASDLERELYNTFIQLKTNNKKFELSDTFLGFGHRDELYKGTIFVPVKESIVAAAISGGQHINMTLATDLELRELGYDPSKINSYKKSEYHL